MRAFEEVLAEGSRDDLLDGLLHLGIGTEAVTVGVMDCLIDDDRIYTAHRPHGHFLAAGVDARSIMAELAGRETGLCRGRGGTLHLMSDRAVMATGIVGGQLSVAVGHALRQPAGTLVAAFFGDGAAQTGAFHESLNLATLWRAPVLFVCENNGVAEFTPRSEHTTVASVVDYAAVYGIPTTIVDGSDVEEVAARTAILVEGIRRGSGPALLEATVTRLRPHYEGDWRAPDSAADFIDTLESVMVEIGADKREIARRRAADVDDARLLLASVLQDDPLPDPADDMSLVFARPLT